VLVLSAPFGRDASGVGAEPSAMIHYKCPRCGVLMESPASMAGRVEVCGSCGARCRLPTPKPASLDPEADIPWARAAAGASARGRPAAPRCQFCGGSMAAAKQPTRGSSSRVIGGVAMGIGLIGLVSIVVLALVRTTGPAVGPEVPGAAFGSLLFVLLGLVAIGGSRKVLRCRSCGAVVPRA